MRTRAVRLYGAHDLRLEQFELPAPGGNEILARVVTDSVCMSSHKATLLGAAHKRVPDDVAENPVIIGHELCGEVVEPGARWAQRFPPGTRFTVQVALNLPGDPYTTPGYSFPYTGGAATYIILPECVMEQECLLPYGGSDFFGGSLSEPMSCIIGAFHASYHTKPLSYTHEMGIRPGGRMALFAAAGPMGLGAIDYAIHAPRRPAALVVTDIDGARLSRAAAIHTPQEAARRGVRLVYLNTRDVADPAAAVTDAAGGKIDDAFVFAPVSEVIKTAGRSLGYDGCLNFFAGPADTEFRASLNFFDVHYSAHHIVGTSGGNTEDMREALGMMERGELRPAAMVTHIGGLECVPWVTENLPGIPGGKKLIYTHSDLPLTAIEDFGRLGESDPFFARLDRLTAAAGGLWCREAEEYLLAHTTR